MRGGTQLCQAYLLYINRHTEQYRQELLDTKTRSLIFNLHTMESKCEEELKWVKKVVSAYEFHKESAHRQSDTVTRQIANLQRGELLLWLDWKANWTLPLRDVATNDAYWATSRREVSCLGCVAYKGRSSGPAEKVGMVFISDIIDHSCLAACLHLEDIKRAVSPLSQYTRAALWFDCGPHYRTADLCSYIANSWLAPDSQLNLQISINFFCEKHGKGQCDSLFGMCSSWVRKALMVPGTSLVSSDDLIGALKTHADKDMQDNPPAQGGMKYCILKWHSEKKPDFAWKAETDLQIQKTYCVSVRWQGGRQSRFLQWQNHRFSDLAWQEGSIFDLRVLRREIPAAERTWRVGFYTNMRWQRSFPNKNERNSLLSREDALASFTPATEAAESASVLERKVARYEAFLKRVRDKRRNQRLTLRSRIANGEPSDSSTSSSDSDSCSDSA